VLDTGPVRRSPQSQRTQRWLAVAFSLAAMGAIAGGLLTRKVLVDQSYDVTVSCGLKACEACLDQCHVTSLFELTEDSNRAGGDVTSAWAWSGSIAWWAAVVALIGLVLATAMVASGKYIRLPVMSPTTIALVGGAIALVGGCIFVATKPEGIGVTRVGWTFWAFGGGVVGAITSAFLLSRQLALLEPEFDPGESPESPPDEPWQDV
jgi:hypothetical protein